MSQAPSHDTDSAKSELGDILLRRDSAWLRFWQSTMRAAIFLVVLYVVNVVFDVVEVLIHDGWAGLGHKGSLSDVLFVASLQALVKQVPSIALPVLGALGVFLLVAVTAGIWYRRHRRNLIKKLERDQSELLAWWGQVARGVNLESLRDRNRAESAKWVREMVDRDAPRRLERLHDVQSWCDEDDLLEDWILHLIQRRRFARNLLLSLLTPTAAIIGARMLLLLRGM